MDWTYAIAAGALFWLVILLLPWHPWLIGEVLEAREHPAHEDFSDVTAIVPARNEAETIGGVLGALARQGSGLRIVVVDDRSEDATAEVAVAGGVPNLTVVRGAPLPPLWAGKVWALEQGLAKVRTPLVLLIDADIGLTPGMLAALRRRMRQGGIPFISVMARLPMGGFWEKLLFPAFVYFFRLLYPFALSNDPRIRWIAAAAGGCVLLETRLLGEIGGFRAIQSALIDDCRLARKVKERGCRTWIGLTRSARSTRASGGLRGIWDLVARSAFPQLRYSIGLVLMVTVAFAIAFWLPVAGLLSAEPAARALGAAALAAMGLSYIPVLRFYRLSAAWALAMPLVGTLYLAMTWTSAVRHWSGAGLLWKGRRYADARDRSSAA